MKLRNLVFVTILALAAPMARAQVFESYYQGFEVTEAVNFISSSSTQVVYDSQLMASGNRSIKLMQSTTEVVSLITDTLDFTQNTTLHYFALEFDHICNADLNAGSVVVGKIYVKRPSQTNWEALNASNYNRTRGGSDEFQNTLSFSRESYIEWQNNTMTNDYWKSERFDLDNKLGSNIPPNDRKIQIKFELVRKISGSAAGKAWWLDNIRVRASQSQMIAPTIKMRLYPDGGVLPSSRGARIEYVPATTVSQGICADSVYIMYTVGSDPTPIRLQTTPVVTSSSDLGPHTKYVARIPFEGYDTLMRFYCVAKDATTNHNEITFPETANSWVDYRCIRGTEFPGIANDAFNTTGQTVYFPFPNAADGRSEWIYDSAMLANAGILPGAIVSMRYTVAANNTRQVRPKFQIRMKNAPTSYTVGGESQMQDFTFDYMHIVYDSTLVIDEVGAGSERTIYLQDSFFYAGKDIVVQMLYDGTTDMGATSIRTQPAPANKTTKIRYTATANYGFNTYTSENMQYSEDIDNCRPVFVLTAMANQPLHYDLGISGMSFPNETNPIVSQPSHLVAILHNYGADAINGVRISYSIDDTIPGYYDWTGSLVGGAETPVQILGSLNLPAGYHYIRTWVEDTLTVGTALWRDHEPYNDTNITEFIVCDGPMNGVRYIGGPTADYNTIEEFLFALSQCGIDDSLKVVLAEGEYPPFTLPVVSGISEQNYLVFTAAPGATATIKANGTTADLINLENTPYVRLRGLRMLRTEGTLANMVLLGQGSTACHIENCTLIDSLDNPPSSLRIGAMINTGFANNLRIIGNTIIGGEVGIDVTGQADDVRSQHNRLERNITYNQFASGIRVTNQSNITVYRNEMYDVLSNSSYVLRVMNCYDTVHVLANKMYTSHGGQALGVSYAMGTAALPVLIANNMVVCNDDGVSNQQLTPFNIIQGQWMDVVYNSVKLTAESRNNVAAATFGGGPLTNSRFINNIVTCYDESNYAFSYIPGTATNNTIGHNVYYSRGRILNRRTGGSYNTIAAWRAAVEMDSLSVSLDPTFLNGSLVDLRTFNRLVKGVGIPLTTVTTDMFDTLRSATAPCPGAFEFVSLYYDFEPEALLNPLPDNCDMPSAVEAVLVLRNSGVNDYVRTSTLTLNLGYSVNGTPGSTYNVTRTLPHEDTIVVNTGWMLSLPPNGIYDSVYNIKVWTISSVDPNQTNDTNTFQVISRYHAVAPPSFTDSVQYNNIDTLVATGATQWPLYNAAGAPTLPSTFYWYYSPDDEEPFQSGTTYITDTIRQDTNFYIRQHREIPIVRITQVQLFRSDSTVGLTDPMPEWINANTKIVVQLTNVGDDTAYLENDSILFVSPMANANNKFLKFPAGVTIAPGASLAVQFHNTNGLTNQLPYMVQVKQLPNIVQSTDFGIVYRSHGVKDAVAFNNVVTAPTSQSVRWSNLNVPSYVWSGNGLPLANEIYCGVVRRSFNGNSSDWLYATEDAPMNLAATDPAWLRYTANNCLGEVGVAAVRVIAPPAADIELNPLPLPEGCSLGDEIVSVRVQNFGMSSVNNLQLHYTARGNTVNETFTTSLPAGGDTIYNFQQPLNLIVDDDSVINIVIWATHVEGDPLYFNDTARLSVRASHTPDAPIFPDTITIAYATSDTLVLAHDSISTPLWYDYDGNMVGRGSSYITDVLYAEGEMAVSVIHHKDSLIHIGTLANVTGKTAFPSPYQPNNKQSKQQFIYSASELRSMGMLPGAISGVSFYLDSIHKVNNTTFRDSVVFDTFSIAIGFVSDTIFANNTAWKNVNQVYYRNNLAVYRNSSHDWVEHIFDNPVMWDGVQNVVVQVVTYIDPKITTGVQTAYTAKSNTTLVKNADSGVGAGYTGSGTKGNNRPDIRFLAKVYGCEGPSKFFHVALDGVPETDATVYMPDGSDTLTYSSCGSVTLNVVVRNMGRNPISNYKLHYSVDGGAFDSVAYNHTLVGGATDSVALFTLPLMPGHHYVTAAMALAGDSVTSNDTLHTSFNVRFCAGDYTIGHDSISEYHSFMEAIDSLQVAGIDGPVVFHVAGGVYQEQVVLGPVEGSSVRNSITFRGSLDTSNATVVRAANTAQANYVVIVDGVSNIVLDSIEIVSRPASGNNGNTLVLQNCSNVTVSNCVIRSKGTINNAAASCIVLQGDVSKLVLSNNVIDSGYYSLTFANNTTGYSNFILQDNLFQNFHLGAVNLKGLSGLNISGNTMVSSYKNKQTGVYLENVDSTIVIQKNKIYLTGVLTGASSVIDNNARRGLDLKNVSGTNQQWGFIANNMIGVSSNGVSGMDPVGINVDGTSGYLNIYYNSVRVYAGATDATKSKAFASTAQTHHLRVMNNILSNFSQAYAYHVASTNNIIASDYNAYYVGGAKFASWGGVERVSLTELQAAAGRDGSSVNDIPYFNAPDDLHLRMTNFVAKAQYNTDVIDDIDGNIRNQIPAPTIGAQEMERMSHNMSVIEIVNPTLPANINVPNDVESDTLKVKVLFGNNGNATETNVSWYAYVEGTSLVSAIKSIGTFSSGQRKLDSLYLPTVLGVIDTQKICVVVLVNSDDDTTDNRADTSFYLAPAYDLQAVRMTVPSGCNLEESQISITIKNVGFKSIPQGVSFEMGYHTQAYTQKPNNNINTNKLAIRTMVDTVREIHSFDAPLARNASRDFVFDSLANLYPTDTALNIWVRVNGWCNYIYDVTPNNDSTLLPTSSSPQVESWYTPDPPFGFDTTFAYATWGKVRAMQHTEHSPSNLAGLPVRWYRDSTDAPFYNVNNYNNSCWWQTTPQYFHDSTYYLQCFSNKNCPSHFSEVHVSVAPRVPVDVGLDGRILAPLGNRVYMENDTMRVVVVNFGTQPQSNIPVAFELRRGNNTNPLQVVRDTIRTTIPAGQEYVFTFDTLIRFASATQSGTYQLRVWTELAADTVKRNDTIRCVNQLRPPHSQNNQTALDYVFQTLGNSYYEPANLTAESYVFTRISYNEIDFDIPPLNRFYTNLSNFASPDYPVLHVRRGLSDTLFVKLAKSTDPSMRERAKVAAYIDYDRSGIFEENETVVSENEVQTNETYGFPITIRGNASLGYMKMRLVSCDYEATPNPSLLSGTNNIPGHMVDFLIYVEPNPPTIDLAFTQIANPRSYLIRDVDTIAVSFRVSNKGTQPITQFTVNYQFDSDSTDSTSVGSFVWRGTTPLMGGTSAIVTLPMHYFPIGTTHLTVWHDMAGDTVFSNNTLEYEYHRFHTITIRVNENFDSLKLWYAPVGYNNYSRNYWQLGTPHKSNISGAFSEPNAWVTDTAMVVTTGRRGNVSYLYSPIINIAQIHSDTIAFRLLRNLIGGSSLRLEYYDYENNWTNVVDDSMMATNAWYNDPEDLSFDGTSAGNAYNRHWACTGGRGGISGNFNEKLQFRFVYTTPIGTNDNDSYGDGCAIDDFYIGRAQRGADVGVVAITKPTAPRYGEIIYPEVVVENYGYDTSFSQQIGYTYYGTTLARLSSYSDTIPPGARDTIPLVNSFLITSDFPDTFAITAFTIMAADIYNDNDTTTRYFILSPLDNDISAEEFLAPLDRVIAGDSTCVVTMRIRNFGLSPIDDANLTYIVNDDFSVTEHVDFNQVLGRPLQSTEFFNYTFEEHFLASMGMMRLVGIVKSTSNEYIYNDTINKRFDGISSITDLAASAIIVDTDRRDEIKVAMIIENRGARGANGFEVGFWIDNDTNTMYRTVYSSEMPIPALTTGYFLFDSILQDRSAPYDHVSAYVRVEDDNDRTNDTTNILVSKYVDLEAMEVVVEENAGEDCRVFFRMRNLGNILFGRRVTITANVNNNQLTLSYNAGQHQIAPMASSLIEFNRTIPKDPQRHYYGSAALSYASDADTSNNQTNIVRVVNYVENVPEVGAGELVLDQNYPNPFSGKTTIPFSLPNASEVTLFVMDAMGHIVHTENGFFAAGSNSIVLDLDRFATGVYYYGIEVDGVRQMRKMVLR